MDPSTLVPMVDISEAQRTVDPAVMKDAGVAHCAVRGHNGGRRDLKVDTFVPALQGAGIGVPLIYGFCNPKAYLSAHEQGTALGRICNQYGVRTGMADVEDYSREPGTGAVLIGAPLWRWLGDYLDALEQVTQSKAVIYTGAWYWDGRAGGSTAFADRDVILSGYPGLNPAGTYDPLPRGVAPSGWAKVALAHRGPAFPKGWSSWAGWQWSAGGNGQGPVYGCASNDLDLNIIDPDALARWYSGGHHAPDVITNQEDAVTDEDRQKIIDGVVAALAGADVDHSPLGPMVTKKTFDVVYGLWRSPEILNALIDPRAALDAVNAATTRASGSSTPADPGPA